MLTELINSEDLACRHIGVLLKYSDENFRNCRKVILRQK